jgi:[CysO sulfur-carrier protein]-S-L-cysteine hydrolase
VNAITDALGRPAPVHLSAAMLQTLVDHARAGYPNEACGIVAGEGLPLERGSALRFHPMRNAAESPARYRLDPQEQLDVMMALEEAGEDVWAIFHSHVRTPAEPSPTDIGLAFYPDALYLICSLGSEVPEVRAWTIRDGEATEVPLSIG